MTSLRRVVLFPGSAEVRVLDEHGSRMVPIRIASDLDSVAGALAAGLGTEVAVDDAATLPPPEPGVIYLCRPDLLDRIEHAADHAVLARHVVAFDVTRSYVRETCERHGLAAAIGSEQLFLWRDRGNRDDPAMMAGLTEVGRAIGATGPQKGGADTSRYALLWHRELRTLPALLGAYLRAYAARETAGAA